MKEGLCVLGLCKNLTNKVSQNLATKLDMFYLDVDELVEYELMNQAYIEEQCGREYLLKLQRKCVKRTLTFENSLLTMNYSLLNDDIVLKNVKDKCLVVFIELSKENYIKKEKYDKKNKLKNILETYIYDERNLICKNIADICLNVNGLSYLQIANLIIKNLKEYYNNI